MIRTIVICMALVLPGCAVTLHGSQTTGGGSTATTTGASVQGGTRIGNARIGGSFGAPPAAGAPGGQVTFSKGASAVLVLGLVVAGVVDTVADWFEPAPPPRRESAPGGIAHTCSCYGWQPELTPAPASQ